MNKTAKHILTGALLSTSLLMPIAISAKSGYDNIRDGFSTLPDSIQTSVYWHWLSGNISEEGVTADLEAMKRAGIDRAFIANIGLQPHEAPTGNVHFMSDEWWRILHTALKKASELDIEIGIFNSAGWSQAGGPWVKPEQSMRRVATVHRTAKGGGLVRLQLPTPSADFSDVKVLAYPSKTVSSISTTECGTPQDGTLSVDLAADSAFTLRSVRCLPTCVPMMASGVLYVKRDGKYDEVSCFALDRRNPLLYVGFDPYAAVSVAVPETAGREFRLVFSGLNDNNGFRGLTLSSAPVVDRFEEKTFAKMYQEPLPYWKEYRWPSTAASTIAASASDVLDISHALRGDTLVWDAPAGNWEIVRVGMLPTCVTNSPALAGEGLGLEIDKMSRRHLKAHYDAFIGEILHRIPPEDRRTWRVVVADSYEVGGQNFTDDFLDKFEKRFGYSAVPFLPVYEGVVVESSDASDRFLWDMRKLVAESLAYDHAGALTELCHSDGLTTWLENYGHWGFMGEFLQYGGQADEVAGEFWSEGDLGNVENRAASSCAHIYGKPKVSSESFTYAGAAYSRYPRLMKQRADRFFAEGINNTLLHVCISQNPEYALPGLNTWYGNEFNRNNTWFGQLDTFIAYLKRCNFMLQQGRDVADVCYFIGEDTPKMTGICDPALPAGYQFDYINAEVILRDMTVKDGRWTLPHGTSYRVMVLPPQTTMTPELLEKLEKLVADGGILLGPAPLRSPSYQGYPAADRRVADAAARMWRGEPVTKVGKGMVLTGMDMAQALSLAACESDFATPEGTPVLFSHRQAGDVDIYFVTNQSDAKISFPATFRATGRKPELWDAAQGTVRGLPSFTDSGTATTLSLELAPLESVFVVFGKKGKADKKAQDNFPTPQTIATVTAPWTIEFDPAFRGPAEPLTVDSLFDLSTSSDEAVRHYSGTLIYRSEFTLARKPSTPVFVNLGDIMVMARVKINGKETGGAWTAPYRIDITKAARKGCNTIEVEVANTWVNRLIGDAAIPENQRPTWSPNNPYNAASPLQKSGLLGPVSIETINYVLK